MNVCAGAGAGAVAGVGVGIGAAANDSSMYIGTLMLPWKSNGRPTATVNIAIAVGQAKRQPSGIVGHGESSGKSCIISAYENLFP